MWQQQQIAAIQIANQLLYSLSAPSSYSLNQRPPPLLGPPQFEDNVGDTDAEDDEELRTLYVGNLDDRVTEDLLYEAFLQAGPIESLRLPKDNNGRLRGFGFVVYSHRCTPNYAKSLLAGLTLYRRMLIIKFQGEQRANKRRSLPSDCERYMPRASDNSMLRNTSYPSFFDPNMNINIISPQSSNPFKTNSPDVMKGALNRSRERGNKDPYKREDRRQRDEGNRNRR